MDQGIIKKGDLGKLIESVKKDYRVYGPVKVGADVALSQISAGGEIELEYFNLKLPAKGVFFPQTEVICTYDNEGVRDVPLPKEKTVVFGIRPCDARSLLLLDKVFAGDIKDPYYLNRRKNTVIVSRACNDPLDTCFCTSLGGSPSGKEGADVLAFDLDGSLLFEAVNEKGEKFMQTYSGLFSQPGKNDLKARDESVVRAQKQVAAVDVSGIKEKLDGIFDSPLWDQIQQTCLGCGACTYLCPTCHCFTIFDDRIHSTGERIRCWDSCQYPAFTLEASGHNPRVSGRERMRQRIMHKFNYFGKNFGEEACVGCGRCVENCPVNLDLREVVAKVKEATS